MERVPGKFERLGDARHDRDLALCAQPGGHPRGLRFEPSSGQRAVDFLEGYCSHHKGEWAGQPLLLNDAQRKITMRVFGWLRADGTRRFRTAYIEVPRKFGKSTTGGGYGLFLTVADGEQGAEVYSSAPLDLATPVPTPSGWTTMGELRKGDRVFDETGRVTTVLSVSATMFDRQCFAVDFHDGESVVTDAGHLWSVESVQSGSLRGRPKDSWVNTAMRRGKRVVSTAQIRATLKTPLGASNHSVPVAGALQTRNRRLPIPPYTLGVWLGDGRQNRGSIVFHPSDAAIAERIHLDGYETRRHCLNGKDGLYHFTILGLRTKLRELGLLERKHVPSQYMRASIKQRLALLQGLMDTDGTCTKTGECRFTNRNLDLAQAVSELAVGLGMQPHLRAVQVTGRPHYIVSFMSGSVSVFHLERKRARQGKPGPKARRRYIVAVRPVDSRPVRCIEVDSLSHLFLVGRSMVPTHNTKKDQAAIVWKDAAAMVKASAKLKRFVKVQRNNLSCERLGSKFEPLSADSSTMDGLNPHGNIIDELHAHRDRGVWDVLDTAMGSRRQPLTIAITTAGKYDPESIGWQTHDYAQKVLEGVIEDDSFFAFIAAADEPPADQLDYYFSEAALRQANPGYGTSPKADYLQKQAEKAKNQPSFFNTYLQLHLNVWTRTVTRWLSLERWADCEPTVSDPRATAIARETELEGRLCYGGLDLSTKLDLSALVLVFAGPDNVLDVVCRFWLPENTVTQYARKGQKHYEQWQREGWLTVTPGDVVDYDFIRAEVNALSKRFKLHELGFDPWGATQLATQLMGDDLKLVEVRQGYKSLSEPSKDLEARIIEKKVRHANHPILRFCVSNAVVTTDPAGNIKPDKEKAVQRIDGVVALVMAMSRLIVAPAGGGDAYADRGFLQL